MADLADAHGAELRYGTGVERILVEGGRVAGIALTTGEHIAATRVVANADAAALAEGLFGREPARAVARVPPGERSLSAVTVAVAAPAAGFSPGAPQRVLLARLRGRVRRPARRPLPRDPTVYVCAQDRHDHGLPDGLSGETPEALLCLVNAPARGAALPPEEFARCHDTMSRRSPPAA